MPLLYAKCAACGHEYRKRHNFEDNRLVPKGKGRFSLDLSIPYVQPPAPVDPCPKCTTLNAMGEDPEASNSFFQFNWIED